MWHGAASGSRSFRFLLLAEGASVLGDQLAKVGVSVLVFELTGSAGLTAVTYAMTLLPDLLAGPLLAPLADRFPRRTVMIVGALAQAVFAATRAVPGLPVAAVAVAVACVTAGQAPFKAAQAVTVRDVLPAERNKSGQVRLTMVREFGQFAGLAGAAGIVAAVGPRPAIAIDAASFAVAAALVYSGVPPRPAPPQAAPGAPRRSGLRTIRADGRLRALAWLALLGSVTILPDAVIVPLVAEAGAPTWTVGPLLAADSVGFLIAAQIVDRYCRPRVQRRLIGPLAVMSLAALVPIVFRPSAAVIGVLLVISGVGASHLPLLRGEVVELAPDAVTGAVTGWIRAGLRAGQGAGALLGGGLAEWLESPALAVALLAACAAVATAAVAVQWRRYAHGTAEGVIR